MNVSEATEPASHIPESRNTVSKSTALPNRGPNIEIKPRPMSFPFSTIKEKYFFDDNALKCAFSAALSSTFPPGEGEFIESVRLFRDKVEDPELKRQISGFIGQEGHHSLQHKRINETLRDLGWDAVRLEKHVQKDINRFEDNNVSPKFRLAATVGMEHLTAIMADHLLRYPEILESMSEPARDLLLWHAVEEIEHKSVAFDVYMTCVGNQAFLRRTMRIITVFFTLRILSYMVVLLWWNRRLPSWRDIKGFGSLMFGKKGIIRGIRQPYKDYFRKGFHPWDHQNQAFVDKWKKTLYRPEHDRSSQHYIEPALSV